MDHFKAKDISGYLFYTIALLALITNIFFDYFAYTENSLSDKLGYSVRNAFMAEKALDNFKRSLTNDHSDEKKSQNKAKLESYAEDFPYLHPVLNSYQQGEKPSKELNQAIQDAETQFGQITDQRHNEDRDQNINVENRLINALNFDLIFILIMVGLFVLNVRSKRKIEDSLRQSQKALINTLCVLEEQAVKRKIATKSIIHDLKNPIGTIIGFAELIKDEPTSKSSVIETSERIQKISQRSLQLVESLLTESDEPIPFSLVDLKRIVQEVYERMQILSAEKDQRLILNMKVSTAYFYGNEIKLDEVFTNLISNAIKYSPKSTVIVVSLSETNSAYQFVVKDRGPGFSSEDKLLAFQFATRLSAKPTNGEASSGIGLYVVKGIVDAHRAKVSIKDNSDGVGSSLIVEFPKNDVRPYLDSPSLN